MDKGAQTIPNFLRTYNPDIIGGSLGDHLSEVHAVSILVCAASSEGGLCVQLCYDIICPPFQYVSKKDVFNAAQSGAMVTDLVSHEFSYLLDQLKKVCSERGESLNHSVCMCSTKMWTWLMIGSC